MKVLNEIKLRLYGLGWAIYKLFYEGKYGR